MSTIGILNELPKLRHEERRAIARRIFELEGERDELDWASEAADQAFLLFDRLEVG
jgi:hypothetical protein